MVSPIPVPLPPWAKFALRYGPIIGGFLWGLLDHEDEEADPSNLEWRKLMVRYADGTSAEARDDIFATFDLVNITGGSADATWTTSDYTSCETLFDAFFTSMKPYFSSAYTVDQYRWYRRVFNPYSETKAFADSGPPDRIATKSINGTLGTRPAAQVACAITEKTPWPKHWGRTYLPAIAANMDVNGYWTIANCDSVAGFTNTLYNGLATAEFYPVVPVTQVAKDPHRCLVGVTQIQIDNVPDVVRRRRRASTTYRKVLP